MWPRLKGWAPTTKRDVFAFFIYITVRLVPVDVMSDLRGEADRRLSDERPRSIAGAVIIGWIRLSIAALAIYWMVE